MIQRKTNQILQFFSGTKVSYSNKKPSEKRAAELRSKGAICSFGVGQLLGNESLPVQFYYSA